MLRIINRQKTGLLFHITDIYYYVFIYLPLTKKKFYIALDKKS